MPRMLMQKIKQSEHFAIRKTGVILLIGISLLLTADPATAHHAMGNQIPSNFFEGFVSGLAHPIIGLDHFAFVVAIALLGSLHPQGIFLPVVFAIAAMAGTGIHLLSINLPAVEIVISASVLVVGIVLGMKKNPNLMKITGLAAIAGIFHGYAYGESIIGAEMTPLIAYLIGFTLIQMAIAFFAFTLARKMTEKLTEESRLNLRFAGFTICGVGAAFLASSIVG